MGSLTKGRVVTCIERKVSTFTEEQVSTFTVEQVCTLTKGGAGIFTTQLTMPTNDHLVITGNYVSLKTFI